MLSLVHIYVTYTKYMTYMKYMTHMKSIRDIHIYMKCMTYMTQGTNTLENRCT